jgi:TolB protein
MPPAMGKIAFVSWEGNYEIYLMNADGSNPINLTNNPANDLQPVWSPDGQHIAFSSDRDGHLEIYVMKADGSQQTRLTHSKDGVSTPDWSPDGSYIIFLSDQDQVLSDRGVPTSEVYMMKTDGTEQRRMTNNQDFERELSWSPKGDVIAISVNIKTPSGIYWPDQIYLLDLDGIIQERLTTIPYSGHPTWSPDGEFIAFTNYTDIYIMKADGSDLMNLTKSNPESVHNIDPSWSPDGKYIVFSSNRDGTDDLYVMRTDGTDLLRLTNMPGNQTYPVWLSVP